MLSASHCQAMASLVWAVALLPFCAIFASGQDVRGLYLGGGASYPTAAAAVPEKPENDRWALTEDVEEARANDPDYQEPIISYQVNQWNVEAEMEAEREAKKAAMANARAQQSDGISLLERAASDADKPRKAKKKAKGKRKTLLKKGKHKVDEKAPIIGVVYHGQLIKDDAGFQRIVEDEMAHKDR
eukprot:gnl/TRDRNA2_/TRDRNA2_182286_c0_seq1.p1 gnl/TRDRNA2_/TRDRNA2_182286_c0~~gnl/TRDRNA2_/TRDRNA2_182286_c0_seq1.p1  ORF type:complete len:186 (+),score=64.87 gnl/TRDRNA2_/TRDRNA2_182286_c0_seq1:41-598(+)